MDDYTGASMTRRTRPTAAWLNRFVRDNRDMILSMYADECLSFNEICARIEKELPDREVKSSMLRFAFLSDPHLNGAYLAAGIDRAHTLAEEALGHAQALARQGEHDKAAAIKMKLASKYSPRHYGDKLDPQPMLGIGASTPEGLPDSALEAVVQKFMLEQRAA